MQNSPLILFMKKPIAKIIAAMKQHVGKTTAVVFYRSPFLVLVSTVLSQRTKDANTAKASAQLFSKLKTPAQIATAPIKKIESLIKPSGFYRVKARHIKELSKQLVEQFHGRVPQSLEELLSLKGVGRKTANCVLVFAFRKPAVPVDTHVHRISNRIGLVKTKLPEQTETALMKTVPKHYWIELNELMVKFGQRVCLPRNPRCGICKVSPNCDYFKRAQKIFK